MALINPQLLNAVNTVAAVAGYSSPNSTVRNVANGVRVGTAVTSILNRPKVVTGGTGGGTSDSNSMRGTMEVLRNLETIIIRLETSNSYLKIISDSVNPKNQNTSYILKEQSRLMYAISKSSAGKFFLNTFGRNLVQNYALMMKTFGPALQSQVTTTSEIFMYKLIGKNPFFKKFFGNIEDILNETIKKPSPFNEETKLTINNIIPNKLDAMIKLQVDQVKLLSSIALHSQLTSVQLRGFRLDYHQMTQPQTDILQTLNKLEQESSKKYLGFMKNADVTLKNSLQGIEELKDKMVSMGSALLGVLEKPLAMFKTLLSHYFRLKLVTMFAFPFWASFKGTQTGKKVQESTKGITTAVSSTAEALKNKSFAAKFWDSIKGTISSIFSAAKEGKDSVTKTTWFQDIKYAATEAIVGGFRAIFKAAMPLILGIIGMKSMWRYSKTYVKDKYESFQAKRAANKNTPSIGIRGNIANAKQGAINFIGQSKAAGGNILNAGKNFYDQLTDANILTVNTKDRNIHSALNKLGSMKLKSRIEKDNIKYGNINTTNKFVKKDIKDKIKANNIVLKNLTDLKMLDSANKKGWTKASRKHRTVLMNVLLENAALAGYGPYTGFLNEYIPRNYAVEDIKSSITSGYKNIKSAYKNTKNKLQSKYNDVNTRLTKYKDYVSNTRVGKFGAKVGRVAQSGYTLGKSVVKGAAVVGKTAISGIAMFTTKAFALAAKTLNVVGIATAIGYAIYAGIKTALAFVGSKKAYMDNDKLNDNRLMISTVIMDFVKGAVGMVVKAVGLFFNKKNFTSIMGGIFDALKGIGSYLAAMTAGGILSMGQYIVNKATGIFGFKVNFVDRLMGMLPESVSKAWEEMSKGFNEGANTEINLKKTAQAAYANEKQATTQEDIANATAKTAENTSSLLDYIKPKSLAVGLGYGMQKFSSLYSSVLGSFGGDSQGYDNSVNNYFKGWRDNSDNKLKNLMGYGFTASAEGISFTDAIDKLNGIIKDNKAVDANTESTNKNTESTNALTAALLDKAKKGTGNLGTELNTKGTRDAEEIIRQQKTGKWHTFGGRDSYSRKIDADARKKSMMGGKNGQKGDPVYLHSTSSEIYKTLKESIKNSEGKRLSAYTDTTGNRTIGYGHKIRSGENYTSINDAQADMLFDNDFNGVLSNMKKYQLFGAVDPISQAVLVDMGYNMGPGFLKKWPMLSNALAGGDYESAASEIMKTNKPGGYLAQVKNRARRNAAALRTGIFTKDSRLGANMFSDYDKYPSRNAMVLPPREELLKWLKPIDGTKSEAIMKLHPRLLKDLYGYARELGRPLEVTSAFRTNEEQRILYEKDPTKAAKPGRSKHNRGMAIDINSKTGNLRPELLSKYNLMRPMPYNEPWHVESSILSGSYVNSGTGMTMNGSNMSIPNIPEESNPLTEFFDTLKLMITGDFGQMSYSNDNIKNAVSSFPQKGDPTSLGRLVSVMKKHHKNHNSDYDMEMKLPDFKKYADIISNNNTQTELNKIQGNAEMLSAHTSNQFKQMADCIKEPMEDTAKNISKTFNDIANDIIKPLITVGSPIRNNNTMISNITPINNTSMNSSSQSGGNTDSSNNLNGSNDLGLAAFLI